jgi:hypothetical protein
MVYSQVCDWLNDFVDGNAPEHLFDTWDCTEWINDSEIIDIFSEYILPTYKSKKARDDALQILHALIWEYYHFRRLEAMCTFQDDISAFDRLKNTHSTPQHSKQWLNEKYDLLTASEFSGILKDNAIRLNILQRMSVRRTIDTGDLTVSISSRNGTLDARSWGHRFEPIVRQLFTAVYDKPVYSDLGRVRHKTYNRLAASPDGLLINGRLLEIKAPISRKIIEDELSYDYYCQMQIQMEVCDVGAVEFCECSFKSGDRFVDTSSNEYPAYVGSLAVYGEANNQSTWVYTYSPLFADTDAGRESALAWEPEIVFDGGNEGNESKKSVVLEKKVWQIEGWQVLTLLRNPRWWTIVGLPEYNRFCADLDKARADPMYFSPNEMTRNTRINYPMFLDENDLFD